MQREWRATPADPPPTGSVLGAGLNQPAKAAGSPQLGPEPAWGFAQLCLLRAGALRRWLNIIPRLSVP